MGTVGYMSPEQASGGTADSRSDQFSFGLVLYEMLTGRRAFSRPTAVETLSAIIRDDPPPIGQVESVGAGAGPMDRRPLSREEPGGPVRVDARPGAGSGERARSFFRVVGLGHGRHVGRRACGAGQKARVLRLAAGRERSCSPRSGLVVRRCGSHPPSRAGRCASRSRRRRTSSSRRTSRHRHSPFPPTGTIWCSPASGHRRRRGLWLQSFDSLVSRLLPGTEGATGSVLVARWPRRRVLYGESA